MMRIIETLLLCGKLRSLDDFRFPHRGGFSTTQYASIQCVLLHSAMDVDSTKKYHTSQYLALGTPYPQHLA